MKKFVANSLLLFSLPVSAHGLIITADRPTHDGGNAPCQRACLQARLLNNLSFLSAA
jgi:hypothetical protein